MAQCAEGKDLSEPRPQKPRVRRERPGPLVWIASGVEPCLDGGDITATRGDL